MYLCTVQSTGILQRWAMAGSLKIRKIIVSLGVFCRWLAGLQYVGDYTRGPCAYPGVVNCWRDDRDLLHNNMYVLRRIRESFTPPNGNQLGVYRMFLLHELSQLRPLKAGSSWSASSTCYFMRWVSYAPQIATECRVSRKSKKTPQKEIIFLTRFDSVCGVGPQLSPVHHDNVVRTVSSGITASP